MNWKLICAIALLSANIAPASAGLYTDDLSRCLVEKSTKEDKATLVNWVVAAITQHPSVAVVGKTSAADLEKVNTAAGALFMRLLTESCVEQTKKALKYEGPSAMQTSFGVLGQVATADIFGDANVQSVLSRLESHMDKKKLEALKE